MLEAISQRPELSEAEAADEERIAKIGAANVYAAGADTVCFCQVPSTSAWR